MIKLPPIPVRIASLPRDERGYPVPWFVSWPEGMDAEPEFRLADGGKLILAIKERRCWVCGQPLDHVFSFVIGPMCAINRISAEPPSHPDCAAFSVKACPFLSMPKAKRREAGLPEDRVNAPGLTIARNPGVSLVWAAKDYKTIRVDSGILFELGDPVQIDWWTEGRKANRAEVLESIDSGLPILREHAEADGPEAVAELDQAYQRALLLVPEL